MLEGNNENNGENFEEKKENISDIYNHTDSGFSIINTKLNKDDKISR